MKKLPLLALIVLLSACGASSQPAESPLSGPPGCDEVQYAKLVSGEAAELILACSAFASLDDCPSNSKQPIIDKYEKKFEEWKCENPEMSK